MTGSASSPYKKISVAIGALGFVVQLASTAWIPVFPTAVRIYSLLLGQILSFVGLSYYAKAKGRHIGFGFWALLPIIGPIIGVGAIRLSRTDESRQFVKRASMLGTLLAILGLITLIISLAGLFADKSVPLLIGAGLLVTGMWLLTKVGRTLRSVERRAALVSAEAPTTPTPATGQNDLSGIEGWLAYVALGLALSPLIQLGIIAFVIVPYLYRGDHSGNSLTNYYVYSLLTGTAMVAVQIYLNVLLYAKKKTFPRYMIIFLVSGFLLTLIGDVAFLPTSAQDPAPGFAFLGAAIWVPYFLRSRRVKATFVR